MTIQTDLITALRELMATALDARHVLAQAAANPSHTPENRHVYAVHAQALTEALDLASKAIEAHQDEALARVQALEPGTPVRVASELYEGVAIFEAVENNGLARVRVETTGETLLLDVDAIAPCDGC